MSTFCIECGKKLAEGAKFCGSCGLSVEKPLKENFQQNDTSLSAEPATQGNDYLSWVGLGIAAVVGVSAFITIIELPSEATYVTFNMTIDNILNGGWFTWYSGGLAVSTKIMVDSGFGPSKSGMDASTFRTILWVITGLCVGMSWPATKNGIRKFIRDVTK